MDIIKRDSSIWTPGQVAQIADLSLQVQHIGTGLVQAQMPGIRSRMNNERTFTDAIDTRARAMVRNQVLRAAFQNALKKHGPAIREYALGTGEVEALAIQARDEFEARAIRCFTPGEETVYADADGVSELKSHVGGLTNRVNAAHTEYMPQNDGVDNQALESQLAPNNIKLMMAELDDLIGRIDDPTKITADSIVTQIVQDFVDSLIPYVETLAAQSARTAEANLRKIVNWLMEIEVLIQRARTMDHHSLTAKQTMAALKHYRIELEKITLYGDENMRRFEGFLPQLPPALAQLKEIATAEAEIRDRITAHLQLGKVQRLISRSKHPDPAGEIRRALARRRTVIQALGDYRSGRLATGKIISG